MTATKTINELLREFGDRPYMACDYRRDMAAVEKRFLAFGIKPDEIARVVQDHDYPNERYPIGHSLADDWLHLKAVEEYLDFDRIERDWCNCEQIFVWERRGILDRNAWPATKLEAIRDAHFTGRCRTEIDTNEQPL